MTRDPSLQLLLDAHGAAAQAGRSFLLRRIDEATADHLMTGRRHALLEVRAQVEPSGAEAPPHPEAIGATLAAHLRNLLPVRATTACLDSLRFAVVMPLAMPLPARTKRPR